MPRSRRRRANDRSREARQRQIALEAIQRRREAEKSRQDRYVKAMFRDHAGETVRAKDGREYRVQDDGSLRRIDQEVQES